MIPNGAAVNICFHGIGIPQRPLDPGEAAYWISEPFFHDVLDLVVGQPQVHLSFDDGNQSDVAIGLPALIERGLSADFFVIAGRIDAPGSLSTNDIAYLRSVGMAVGSHGMTHIPWRGASEEALTTELVNSRQVLDGLVGNVTTAACPLGEYDRRALRQLRRAGYTTVFTSDRALARPGQWIQPRYSVRDVDDISSIRDLISGPSRISRVRSMSRIALKRLR